MCVIVVARRLEVFHVYTRSNIALSRGCSPRDYAILLSPYVKAPPSGMLLVDCIQETNSNESAPSPSERSGRNRRHFTGESVVLIFLTSRSVVHGPIVPAGKTAEVIWNCHGTAPGNNGQKQYRFVSVTKNT